jgi:hypothetical protein
MISLYYRAEEEAEDVGPPAQLSKGSPQHIEQPIQ